MARGRLARGAGRAGSGGTDPFGADGHGAGLGRGRGGRAKVLLGADVEAASALQRVAELVVEPPKTGYRYVRSTYQDLHVLEPAGTVYLSTSVQERWVPDDLTQEWVERFTRDIEVEWLPGREGEGAPPAEHGREVRRGACGQFPELPEDRCAQGSWDNPIPSFTSGLPSDPDELCQRLRASAWKGAPEEILVLVEHALGSGMLPASTQASLLRALARVPGLRVHEDSVITLEDRRGTAFGVRVDRDWHEILIDPRDRRAAGHPAAGGRAGRAADGGLVAVDQFHHSGVGAPERGLLIERGPLALPGAPSPASPGRGVTPGSAPREPLGQLPQPALGVLVARPRRDHARAVDQQVDPLVPSDQLVGGVAHGRERGEVELEHLDAPVDAGDRVPRPPEVPAGEHDQRPLAGERPRHPEPDAVAAPGHHRDPSALVGNVLLRPLGHELNEPPRRGRRDRA